MACKNLWQKGSQVVPTWLLINSRPSRPCYLQNLWREKKKTQRKMRRRYIMYTNNMKNWFLTASAAVEFEPACITKLIQVVCGYNFSDC